MFSGGKMADKAVRVEIKDNGVAFVLLDVPDSKVNCLSTASMTALSEAIDLVCRSEKVKAVVIASGKEDNFVVGADVGEIRKIQGKGLSEAYNASQLGKEIFARLESLKVRTVAAINGVCLGGGLELALACDFRVAAAGSKIGLPEVKLGFIPGWGGCVRLPRLTGLTRALEIIMGGKILEARKAWKASLVNEVVDKEQLLSRAEEIALGSAVKNYNRPATDVLKSFFLENNPLGRSLVADMAYKAMMRETKGKYPAPREALKVVLKGFSLPVDKACELESQTFARLAMTDVSANLVGIFFAQQESKKLPGAGSPCQAIDCVGVLGAGVMGAGIAQSLARAGFKVVLKDIEDKFLEKGKNTIVGLFDGLVARKRLSKEEADELVGGIKLTTSYDDLKDCDLVIEAVVEDLKVKQQALADLEAASGRDFVFATNTSSLSVTEIAMFARDPGRVVGLHFFNPVHKMPLVEVVRGDKTEDASLAAAMSVAQKLDKTTVISADAPGFIVNRILAPYLREAAVLVGEGTPVEDIDRAMKSFGMPMGPLTLLDEIGLDIAGKVIHVMGSALGARLSEPPLMKAIEQAKVLGKKGGKGIYLYDEKGKPAGVNPDVLAFVKAEANPKTAGEIQDRLVLLMMNEAARCLEGKVVEQAGQLDLALIFGTGFPPFRGGILRYADRQGLLVVCRKMEYLSRVVSPGYAPCQLIKQMAEEGKLFYCS